MLADDVIQGKHIDVKQSRAKDGPLRDPTGDSSRGLISKAGIELFVLTAPAPDSTGPWKHRPPTAPAPGSTGPRQHRPLEAPALDRAPAPDSTGPWKHRPLTAPAPDSTGP
ncbi:mucin-1-like [Melanotaenia boesemani]|uniref:mucin-1-like n=1 Tax=Melanotaenia boesemani TaxID=1250792 RepID=UPI001C05922A|nr:mucin-1-like [Melanotaenia boesemani]